MYLEVGIALTQSQKDQIAKAVQAGSGAKIKLSAAQVANKSGDSAEHKLLVTKQQMARISKAAEAGKGLFITMSKAQLSAMKKGGFLAAILPAVLGALAPTIFNRLFPEPTQQASGMDEQEGDGMDEEGDGINLPGGNGIMLPGSRNRGGMLMNNMPAAARGKYHTPGGSRRIMDIRPANGEDTTTRVTGRRGSYLPSAELPGRPSTAKERVAAARMQDPSNEYTSGRIVRAGQRSTNMPAKKKAVSGRGIQPSPVFLSPDSDRFKMLE